MSYNSLLDVKKSESQVKTWNHELESSIVDKRVKYWQTKLTSNLCRTHDHSGKMPFSIQKQRVLCRKKCGKR